MIANRFGLLLLALLFASAMGRAHPSAVASPSTASAGPSVAVADPSPVVADPSPAPPEDWDDEAAADQDAASAAVPGRGHHGSRHRHRGNALVSIGHDSHLEAGRQADSVVSILGSSLSDGDAGEVVSVIGSSRVTGPVRTDAVSVLGSTYVDAKVDGDTVAVLGSVELGPHADVGGDVVSVFGSVKRDPAAIVHGSVRNVLDVGFGPVKWLRSWIQNCLLLGRPLAFDSDIVWAWGLAAGFLALYAFLALLLPDAVRGCVRTLESSPGRSLLAAIMMTLLLPVVLVLLLVTVIGIAAIPAVGAAFVCVGLFGRAVVLAWVGGRILGRTATGSLAHPAVAVLVGGIIVFVAYVVPVLGFLVFQLIGFLGVGAVVYTLILAARSRRPPPGTIGTSPDAPPGPAGGSSPSAGVPDPARPSMMAAMARAGFWIRMGALFLDLVLVSFVMAVLHHALHLQLVVLAVYGAIMWKLRGSTIGGIVFDLRVVRSDGREVDWETAIVRALGCFLSLAVAGLGFIWIAFDDDNQAWHDKIAGTLVVRVPKGTPLV